MMERWKTLPLSRMAGRWKRRLGVFLGKPEATLIYHLKYELPDNPMIDTRRAQRILNYLVQEGCVNRYQLGRPRAISLEQLALVHDYDYLVKVSQPEVLERIFGVEVLRLDSEAIISAQRWMAAGTVMAARLAVRPGHRGRPVVSLGGGMHHAYPDHGGGFCLFNDVAVAIAQLRKEGYDGKILIVDLDLHQGDGNRHIFAEDSSVYTFSIHGTDWDEEPAGADLNISLGSGIGDRAYHKALDTYLPKAFSEARPDLVFYVAGVDIAADDKLGSWRVTSDAILRRDQKVLARIENRAFVWVLAGGYGTESWRHNARSLAWLLAGYDKPILSRPERSIRHFRSIANRFTREELHGKVEEDIILKPEDLLSDLVGPVRRSKLMGFYSLYGIELAMEHYGLIPLIREAGYPAVSLELDTSHPTGERLRVFSRDARKDLLIELVLKEIRDFPPFRLLSIEWLLLQNPRGVPTPERPLLPGQQYPGLGCLSEVVLMLVMMCERLNFDGIAFSPAHFHVAAQAQGILAFLDPVDAAWFSAIEEALMGIPLAQSTALIHQKALVDENTGETVSWHAAPMVLPVSDKLKEQFESQEYENAVEEASRRMGIKLRS